MTQKEQAHTCPECQLSFRAATALGRHRSAVHNIPGQSKSSINYRAAKAQREEKVNVRPTKETRVSTRPPTPQPQTHHHQQATQDHTFEATAAFAAGRITELLQSLALQHDLPPKSLTALVLRIVHAQAIR